jgi:hypothetical protein
MDDDDIYYAFTPGLGTIAYLFLLIWLGVI